MLMKDSMQQQPNLPGLTNAMRVDLRGTIRNQVFGGK
jgi:hypothetical protein